MNVADLPFKYWNEKLCKHLLKEGAVYYIQLSKNMRTESITLFCAENDIDFRWDCVPSKLKTRDFCEKIVELQPKFIAIIPKKFVTQPMVNKALKSEPSLIRYIDNKFKTKEICKESVESDPSNVFFVPYSKVSYDMWLSFARRVKNYEELSCFPEKLLPQIKLDLRRCS